MTGPFETSSNDDLARLIAAAPLCWIVPHTAPQDALLMPVLLERDASGIPISLLGHLPRRAPGAAALSADGVASFLFLGANAYVSPARAGRSDWGPTWDFASASLTAQVRMDAALTEEALVAIVAHMEGAGGWHIGELGDRFDAMAAQVIGFRAEITAVSPRFKLGQDEDPPVRDAIRASFAGTPLGEWLDRAAQEERR